VNLLITTGNLKSINQNKFVSMGEGEYLGIVDAMSSVVDFAGPDAKSKT
jgi:hypothetical protein